MKTAKMRACSQENMHSKILPGLGPASAFITSISTFARLALYKQTLLFESN